VINLNNGEQRWESYDQLVIATGALPIRPDVPGSDAAGIYALSNLESGIAVKEDVDRKKPQQAVIVGGGYIGIEMAEALVDRGMDVSVIEMAPEIMGTLDPDMAALLAKTVERHGVHLYREESFEKIETDNGAVRAVVTNKRTIPADIVIMAIGVRPDTELAREAEIPLGFKDAIIVNDRLQTKVANVWAAGDCVQSFHLVSRKPTYIALGTVANRQGRVIGANIGGDYAVFPGVMGTAICKIFDLEMGRTGLQEKEIRDLGLEFVSGTITSLTQAEYYPDAGKITVKLLAERKTGRLLGGQIVGERGSAKRIDTIAVALHAGVTVEEMINLDLSYAPPHSPVWDPVATAARKTASMI
jgi:NADPH-dependent 2,4-dienoyl-CoA reductase/sulfur reductase-like enzyme